MSSSFGKSARLRVEASTGLNWENLTGVVVSMITEQNYFNGCYKVRLDKTNLTVTVKGMTDHQGKLVILTPGTKVRISSIDGVSSNLVVTEVLHLKTEDSNNVTRYPNTAASIFSTTDFPTDDLVIYKENNSPVSVSLKEEFSNAEGKATYAITDLEKLKYKYEISESTGLGFDEKNIEQGLKDFYKVKADIMAQVSPVFYVLRGDIIPYSPALGISQEQAREWLSWFPFDDFAELYSKFTDVLNKITKVVEDVAKYATIAIQTIEWIQDGLLGYVNGLVETFGRFEFEVGPIKLSVGASLTNDISSFVSFNTGIPIADAFLESKVNEFLMDKLPQINIQEALGLDIPFGPFKGPPPFNTLLPNNLRFPSVIPDAYKSNDDQLKASQGRLEYYKENFFVFGDKSVSVDDIKDTIGNVFKKDEETIQDVFPYNKDTGTFYNETFGQVFAAIPEPDKRARIVMMEANTLDFNNKHEILASLLTSYGLEEGAGVAQALHDLVETQSLYFFIKALSHVAEDPYIKFKLTLGNAYLTNDSSLAKEAIMKAYNKPSFNDCLGLNTDNSLLVDAIQINDINSVNDILTNYYLDDNLYNYKNWIDPNEIVNDIQDEDLKLAAAKLLDGKITEFLVHSIYHVNKMDIRLFPNKYINLNRITSDAFNDVLVGFDNG